MIENRDQDFLNRFIESTRVISDGLPKLIVGIKDKNLLHKYCSRHYLELLNVDASEIIGKKHIKNYRGTRASHMILRDDAALIAHRRETTHLLIVRLNNALKPRVIIKSPIINPETENVVGIIYRGFDYASANINRDIVSIEHARDDTCELNRPELERNLTRREKQVIFFFLANFTSNDIAKIISEFEGKPISKSTVDSIFSNQLYDKFEVHSRQALYQRLVENGYEKLIPQELIESGDMLLLALKNYLIY